MNYKKPSSIQEKALPLILKDPYVLFGVQWWALHIHTHTIDAMMP